jgi:hypothetical protein
MLVAGRSYHRWRAVKHVVLVSWTPDADEQSIGEFLKVAPGALARGGFLECDYGEGLKLTNGAANWGFVVEVAKAEDLDFWTNSEAHSEFTAKLKPIVGTVTSIQF